MNSPQPWSQLWQMPALIGGLLLIGLGAYLALFNRPKDDFSGALDTIETCQASKRIDGASLKIDQIRSHIKQATILEQARFAALVGDQIFLKQKKEGWNDSKNHKDVIKWYERARNGGHAFHSQQWQWWAASLLELGQFEQAIELLENLGADQTALKITVMRRIIESRLDRIETVDPAERTRLVEKYRQLVHQETDKKRRRNERIWLAEVDARLLLAAGDPEGTIEHLWLPYQRLREEGGSAGEKDLVPLMIQFGNAYIRTGDFAQADRYFLLATEKLGETDALNAVALIGRAQIRQAEAGGDQAALEFYRQAVQDYPATASYLRALIGQADTRAKLGYHPDALEDFAEAINIVRRRHGGTGPMLTLVESIILSQFDLNFDRSEYGLALDYLNCLQPFYPDSKSVPSSLLGRFADTHEHFALKRREDARAMMQGGQGGKAISEPALRLANIEAAEHFALAADYYHRHAASVSGLDEQLHGQSLWKSATNYDAAERWSEAIGVYQEYVQTRPQDPLYHKAVQNLGLAYMAEGQCQDAADQFLNLIYDPVMRNSQETYNSLVPLARCYEQLGRVDDAIRVLLGVITDHESITPNSRVYQQALIELGMIYYRNNDFELAIPRLEVAAERYGETGHGPELRFLLADAYRQSADQLEAKLSESLPERKQLEYREAQTTRLANAQRLYGESIDALEKRNADRLSPTEFLYLRNAYFYRGDCAFDLGRYTESIGLYNQAARRWDREPASLIALVQIVNAFCELGQFQEAKVANDQARFQFKNIPDSAFEDKTLPMDRKQWEDWLYWADELNIFDKQANADARQRLKQGQ